LFLDALQPTVSHLLIEVDLYSSALCIMVEKFAPQPLQVKELVDISDPALDILDSSAVDNKKSGARMSPQRP
jgi:hypothetical protein